MTARFDKNDAGHYISGIRPPWLMDNDKIRIREYHMQWSRRTYAVSEIRDWGSISQIKIAERVDLTPPIETRLRAYLEELKTTRITPEEVREICSAKASCEFKAGWIRGKYDDCSIAESVRRAHALTLSKTIGQIEALLGEPASDAVKPDYSFWLGKESGE